MAVSSSAFRNRRDLPPHTPHLSQHAVACVRDNRSSPRPATPASVPAFPHPRVEALVIETKVQLVLVEHMKRNEVMTFESQMLKSFFETIRLVVEV